MKRARPRLATRHRLEFRNCFGAVAGYVDGNIFASCGKFGLALRLPSQTLTELFGEPDVSPLKYFEKGHVKKEYAVIPPTDHRRSDPLPKVGRQKHKIRVVSSALRNGFLLEKSERLILAAGIERNAGPIESRS